MLPVTRRRLLFLIRVSVLSSQTVGENASETWGSPAPTGKARLFFSGGRPHGFGEVRIGLEGRAGKGSVGSLFPLWEYTRELGRMT